MIRATRLFSLSLLVKFLTKNLQIVYKSAERRVISRDAPFGKIYNLFTILDRFINNYDSVPFSQKPAIVYNLFTNKSQNVLDLKNFLWYNKTVERKRKYEKGKLQSLGNRRLHHARTLYYRSGDCRQALHDSAVCISHFQYRGRRS